MFKVNKNVRVKFIKSRMSYSESGLDSNFAINSASNFVPTFYESKSESDESESDFSSVFMNLGICIFSFLYLHSSKKIFG